MKNNDTDLDGFKLLALVFLGIPLGILVSLYGTLLVTKIVAWYDVPLKLTFKQWFGVDLIITVFFMSLRKSSSKTVSDVFGSIFSSAFIITIGFALYYIVSTLI